MRGLAGMMSVVLRLAVVVVTVACGFSVSAPASAWVESSAWGQVGARKMFDSISFAGVVCRNDLTSKPGHVAIEARDVLLGPASGYATQTVGVRYLLYQELPGGALDLIDESPLESKPVEASGWAGFGPYGFDGRALGPRYVVAVEMLWYDAFGAASGRVRARVSNYESRTRYPGNIDGAVKMESSCVSPLPASVTLSSTQGTVQSNIGYTLRYYPSETRVSVIWDGKAITTVTTGANGSVAGTLRAPAAPMGKHQLEWTAGNWRSSATFTIVPRIKLIPATVSRGQTVNVSLRGFAARETVRIRWKKGTSWVELARVTTSGTGSANVYVKVPLWAKDGPASVRGDGVYGRAQTNAVTVSGGAPLTSSAVKTPTATPTASPTPTATASATPNPSATPDLPEGSPTAVPSESVTPVTEARVPTETASPEPSPTTTAEPTETSSPTEEPVAPDPTVEPSPTT
jgi:hypothetical protein